MIYVAEISKLMALIGAEGEYDGQATGSINGLGMASLLCYIGSIVGSD